LGAYVPVSELARDLVAEELRRDRSTGQNWALCSQVVLQLLHTVDRELSRSLADSLLPAYAEEQAVIREIDTLLPQLPAER